VAQDYRRRAKGGGLAGAVGIATAMVVFALVAIAIVLVGTRRAADREATPRQKVVIERTDPETAARESSLRALGKRGITKVQQGAIVIRYGSDTYSVTGTCLVGTDQAIYQTLHQVQGDVWSVVSVKINGRDVR
jgi:hypothetical protein